MNTSPGSSSADSSLLTPHSSLPSAFRAWCVLVVQSFQRHWRVRQMGWVSLGLLGIVVFWVALITERGAWKLDEQRARRSAGSNRSEAERLLPNNRYEGYEKGENGAKNAAKLREHEVPNPMNPNEDALRSLFLSIPQAVVRS